MKLLFDENVSWRLVGRLAVLYPEHPRVEAFHSNPEEVLLVLELPVEHAV